MTPLPLGERDGRTLFAACYSTSILIRRKNESRFILRAFDWMMAMDDLGRRSTYRSIIAARLWLRELWLGCQRQLRLLHWRYKKVWLLCNSHKKTYKTAQRLANFNKYSKDKQLVNIFNFFSCDSLRAVTRCELAHFEYCVTMSCSGVRDVWAIVSSGQCKGKI